MASFILIAPGEVKNTLLSMTQAFVDNYLLNCLMNNFKPTDGLQNFDALFFSCDWFTSDNFDDEVAVEQLYPPPPRRSSGLRTSDLL